MIPCLASCHVMHVTCSHIRSSVPSPTKSNNPNKPIPTRNITVRHHRTCNVHVLHVHSVERHVAVSLMHMCIWSWHADTKHMRNFECACDALRSTHVPVDVHVLRVARCTLYVACCLLHVSMSHVACPPSPSPSSSSSQPVPTIP